MSILAPAAVRGALWTRLLSFVMSLALVLFAVAPVLATSIQTDLWVYAQGDTVNVTGDGFGASENVEIVTTDPYAVEVDRGTVTSDEAGNIAYSFVLTSDVPGIYDVVATGLTSGLSAATQFDPLSMTVATLINPFRHAGGSVVAQINGAGSGSHFIWQRPLGGSFANTGISFVGSTPPDQTITEPALSPGTYELVVGGSNPAVAPSGCSNPCGHFGSWGPNQTSFIATQTLTVAGGGAKQSVSSGVNRVTVRLFNPSNTQVGADIFLNTDANGAYTGTIRTFAGGDPSGTWRVELSSSASFDSNSTSWTSSTNVALSADTTAPVITKTVTGTLGSGGWYRSDVTVDWTVTDPESSFTTTGCVDVTYTAETTAAGVTSSCSATSAGGTSNDSVTVKIDKTAPVISAAAKKADLTTYVAGTWTNQAVTVTFSCADGLSGLSTNTTGSDGGTQSTDTSTGSFTSLGSHCVDNAGNPAVTNTFSPIMIDTTRPIITATATKADASPYVAGTWTNQSVTVSFACSDSSGSGLSVNTVGGGGTVSSDTSSGSFTNTGTCTDNAGNSALSNTFSPIMVDKTKPVITATATKADSSTYVANTWTNQSVTVSFSCADGLSGLLTNTVGGGGTENGDTGTGSFTNTGTCTDNAGNTALSNTFSPIRVDKTKPAITATATKADASPYVAGTWTNQSVTVSFSCADALSGLMTNTVAADNGTENGDTSAGSFTSLGTNCVDNAGNAALANTFSPIKVDKTAPSVSLSINSGATWTNDPDVSLGVVASDATSGLANYGFGESDPANTCPQATAGDPNGAHAFTLGAGESASRSVYAAVCDAAGNFAQANDDIGLDTVKPVISISHSADGDNGWNISDPVTEDISASDATSAVASVDCSDDAFGLSTVFGFEPTFYAEVSGEGHHNLSCTATDYAGNTSLLDADTVKIDTVAPTVTISTSDGLAGSGWYNVASSGTDGVLVDIAAFDAQGVTSLSCTDNGVDVGPLALTGDSFVIVDGSHLIECAVSDDAGHDGTDSKSFDVDQTNPSIVTDPSADDCSLPGFAGWCRGTQTAGFSASDATSGVDAPPCLVAGSSPCAFTQDTTTNGSAVTIASGAVADVAGNTASSINSAPFMIDSVAPIVTVSPTRPSPDFGGWYNASLPFDTTGTDATSGVSDANCSANYTWTTAIDGDGTGLTKGGSCTDNAGNPGSGTSAFFDFDDTNPSVMVTPDRMTDHNGWYNAGVTFNTAGDDATSGVLDANCSADYTYATPDGTGLTRIGTCTDNAGNSTTASSAIFKFDNTDPITTISFPTAGGDYNALTWNAGCGTAFVGDLCGLTSDNLSGRESIKYSLQRMFDLKYWDGSGFNSTDEVLLSPSGLAAWMQTFSYSNFPATGFYTIQAPATDLAGNVNSGAPATFKINNPSGGVYGWEGFFSPIDNTLVNKANAGQTIPVKWRITLNGTPVSDPNSFVALTSRLVPCTDLAAMGTDDIETYSTNSGLLYNGNGNWHFNWKTPKSYASQCRVMTITLNDGSTHDADFKFK